MKTEAAAKSGFWWPLICSGSGSEFGVLLLESWHLEQDCFLFFVLSDRLLGVVALSLLLYLSCFAQNQPSFGFRF